MLKHYSVKNYTFASKGNRWWLPPANVVAGKYFFSWGAWGGGCPMRPLPMMHCTGSPGPSGHHWRPVQTCSFQRRPPPAFTAGKQVRFASGGYASYLNAFLFVPCVYFCGLCGWGPLKSYRNNTLGSYYQNSFSRKFDSVLRLHFTCYL